MTDPYKPPFQDDEEADMNVFEQRLGSIRPALPQRSWEEVAQHFHLSDAAGADLAAKSRNTPTPSSPAIASLFRFATHAAAVVVGIGIGVVLMSAQQSPATAEVSGGSSGSHKFQPVEVAPAIETSVPLSVAKSKTFSKRNYKTNRFASVQNSGSMRLTLLTRDIDAMPWGSYQRERSVASTKSSSTGTIPGVLPEPSTKLTAPQLLRKILDDQTNLHIKGDNQHKQKFLLGRHSATA